MDATLPAPGNAETAMTALLVKQLLAASGMGRAMAGGTAVHEGLFLDTLADAVARDVSLLPAAPVPGPGLVDGGQVSSPFGPRRDPFTHAPTQHAGVDVAAPRGAPVRALADGRVARVEDAADYGRMVTLRHASGLESRYAHLEGAAVQPGQQIRAGQILGTVGSSGRSTGPHLHFELRQDGVVVDPTRALSVYSHVTIPQPQGPGPAARRAP
ncbi:MAG: M23 family metallopeptidase [Deltaproteobacteria bacterium]|nr:M23 family metallopeptidase [Deltaproteobacteria bacterium]